MIDSINFLIKDVENLDFKHLVELGIYPKEFKIKKNKFECIGYTYKYKNILFKYNKNFQTILIITNVHKILQKRDIHINDLSRYKNKIYEIVTEVLNTSNMKLELNRIDYCIDIELDAQLKSRYLFLLNQHKTNYKYMKMKEQYVTSIHKSNKNGQSNLNIYARWNYTNKKEDKNTLRIEVQIKRAKIKKEFKDNGIVKDVDMYWSKDSFYENTIELLKAFLYEGNYCSRKRAKEIIRNCNYKDVEKKKLLKFLLMTERYGIDDIVTKKIYCKQTVNKYIEMLNNININPIVLPRIWTDCSEIENLLTLAKRTAEEKYFS